MIETAVGGGLMVGVGSGGLLSWRPPEDATLAKCAPGPCQDLPLEVTAIRLSATWLTTRVGNVKQLLIPFISLSTHI